MTNSSILTISVLTIPEREEYLRRLVESLVALKAAPPPRVDIVYNRPLDDAVGDVIEKIRGFAPTLSIEVYFNAGDTSIVSGRNLQLSVCRTPLIAFLDDDCTLHGDVVQAITETLAAQPLGILGFPSFEADTDTRFKPRESTPSVDWQRLRFMSVQGMLCAGYRALFAEIGGFNPRRRFWGEWTELNLRMWRSGFPTAYELHRGYIRHWHAAPSSPTRNMPGREQHVVWGLICTALEYDAVDVTEATEVFWRLVEERYLAYSYGDELSPKNVLKTVLELVPQISGEWGSIQAFRAQTALHPFPFAPFHRFTLDEVKRVHAHAEVAIQPYRQRVSREVARVSGAVGVLDKPRQTLRAAFGRLTKSLGKLRRGF